MSRINYIDFAYDPTKILEVTAELTGNIYTFKLEKDKVSKISKILNLTFIKDILYFNCPPHLYGIIHKDIDIETGEFTNVYSLNLPLENCQDLYVNWFESNKTIDESIKRTFSKEIIISPSLEKQDSVLLENQKLDRPAFVKDINIWHNAENKSNKDAKFLNIRFYNFVDYKKSLELIEKHSVTG